MMRANEWFVIVLGSLLLLIPLAAGHFSASRAAPLTSAGQPDIVLYRSQLYATTQDGIEVFDLAALQYLDRVATAGPAWPFGLVVAEPHGRLFVTGPAARWQEAQLLPPSKGFQELSP